MVHQIHHVLPLIATTLSMHGMAVSLEGLLLAKKDFKTLCSTYAIAGGIFVAMQWLTRRLGWGLVGVWSAYIWFQVLRIGIFSLRSGVLGFGLAPSARRAHSKLHA